MSEDFERELELAGRDLPESSGADADKSNLGKCGSRVRTPEHDELTVPSWYGSVSLHEVPAKIRARLIAVAKENAGTVDDQIALASDIADLVRRAIKESRG